MTLQSSFRPASPGVPLLGSDAEAIAAAETYAGSIRLGSVERDRTGRHPLDELARLAGTGLLAIRVPRAFGGPGLSNVAVAEVFRIISAADASIGQIPQNHFVFLEALKAVGSDAQKRTLFARILAGARLGNAQTERGTPHAKAITTRLEPLGDGRHRLNGRKYYCTGASSADIVPVLALDSEERQVLAFVDRYAPGVEVIDDWSAIGQRATGSGTVTLTDVIVSDDRIVPHWRIFSRPQIWTPLANLPHVAIDVGIAEAALADALEFLRTRARPWYESGFERATDDPLLLERIGRLSGRVHAAGELVLEAARRLDQIEAAGGPADDETAALAAIEIGRAKAFAGDVAVEAGNDLFTITGTGGADLALGLDRHWRNARTHTLHDPNRWRLHRLGDHFLNGRLPPNNRSN